MTPGALTVVIVAYGREDLLARALGGLDGLTVVVVDNAASDLCRDLVRGAGATYLRPPTNLGFAGGVNHALGSVVADGDVLLLNPDAYVAEVAVKKLQAALHASGRRVACVAPALIHPTSGAAQRVTWPFPSPGRQALIAVGLGRLTHRPDFLVGAVLMLRADAIKEIGPFDERFFLYCEETDWQRRASAQGWSRDLVTSVSAEHLGGATSSESDLQQAYFHAADELYVRKWFGTRGWVLFRAATYLGTAARLLVLRGERRDDARRRLAIYRRGPVRHRNALLEAAAR